jgi:hydroxymethylglutaryl-CoA lyase
MAEDLLVYEVGPRDGLQNEATHVPAAEKIAFLRGLRAVGLKAIEATSFVSPKAIPQMADAPEIFASIREDAAAGTVPAGTRHAALVINEKGYDRAREAGATAVAIVVVVSETLSHRNSRMTVDEGVASAVSILRRARSEGVHRRVYIAPAWVCPYEGPTDPDKVVRAADAIWEAGVDELAIADTIGHAHPLEVGRLFDRLGKRYGMTKLAAHFHDTQALGLANAAAAIAAGVRIVDGAAFGLGGCPFAPGAAGNLATEDLVFLAHKMGFRTGVDLEGLRGLTARMEAVVGRPIGGRTRAWYERSQGRDKG